MAIKNRLKPEHWEHFKTLDKKKLRAFDLTEDEIAFMYDLDERYNQQIGMNLFALTSILAFDPDSDKYLNKALVFLNQGFESGEGTLSMLHLSKYVFSPKLEDDKIAEFKEDVETQLYFFDEELLKALSSARIKAKNAMDGTVNVSAFNFNYNYACAK